jgi:predicted nucleic acid-binding protein
MITLAEVTKTRRGPVAVSEDVEPKITSFFMNEYVRLIPVDHVIGTRARRLIWDSPFLGPRDAIHIATALQVQADAIEHYDNDFARVAREVAEQQTAGFPPIREPQWTGQPTLPGTEPTPPRALDTPQSN